MDVDTTMNALMPEPSPPADSTQADAVAAMPEAPSLDVVVDTPAKTVDAVDPFPEPPSLDIVVPAPANHKRKAAGSDSDDADDKPKKIATQPPKRQKKNKPARPAESDDDDDDDDDDGDSAAESDASDDDSSSVVESSDDDNDVYAPGNEDDDDDDDADDDDDDDADTDQAAKKTSNAKASSNAKNARLGAANQAGKSDSYQKMQLPCFFGSAITSSLPAPQVKFPPNTVTAEVLGAAAKLTRHSVRQDLERAIRFASMLGAYAEQATAEQLAAPRPGSGVAFTTITIACSDMPKILITGNGSFDSMMLEGKNAQKNTIMMGFINDRSMSAVSLLQKLSGQINSVMEMDYTRLNWVDLAVMIIGMSVISPLGKIDGNRLTTFRKSLCHNQADDTSGSFPHELTTKWCPTKTAQPAKK